jgi:hypothetical protein
MHEIETWIEEAASNQRILIRKLPKDKAESAQREVVSRYVKDHSAGAWWMALAKQIDEHYDRNAVKLSGILPAKSGACWLIPETGSLQLPVYEIDASQVQALIDDCYGFEYYAVAIDFSWFVAETHHDQFYCLS